MLVDAFLVVRFQTVVWCRFAGNGDRHRPGVGYPGSVPVAGQLRSGLTRVSGFNIQCLQKPLMAWEYTQLRFVPRGKSWTGEIEELWLDDKQLISRNRPQQVSLVELMNELGSQGWELVTYAQPFTGYHGGCYTFKRQR